MNFASHVEIVPAEPVERITPVDRASPKERRVRVENRVGHHIGLLRQIIALSVEEETEQAERKGWLDAAAFLEREGDHHGAALIRAEMGQGT